jgi:hypothetical protein
VKPHKVRYYAFHGGKVDIEVGSAHEGLAGVRYAGSGQRLPTTMPSIWITNKLPPRENLWALSPRLWFDFCICC